MRTSLALPETFHSTLRGLFFFWPFERRKHVIQTNLEIPCFYYIRHTCNRINGSEILYFRVFTFLSWIPKYFCLPFFLLLEKNIGQLNKILIWLHNNFGLFRVQDISRPRWICRDKKINRYWVFHKTNPCYTDRFVTLHWKYWEKCKNILKIN